MPFSRGWSSSLPCIVLFLGPPGVGKSHICLSLALAAIHAGHTVLYRSAFDLAEDLLEILTRRYEVGASVISSNRPVEDWGVLLGNTAAAGAMLDRFLHHAEIVQLKGRSFRMHDRQQRRRSRSDLTNTPT